MKLDELKVYGLANEIGETVWQIVKTWDYFSKKTIGIQFVKSADSIAANISEGYGRFHYKESRLFYYYARGSTFETKTWSKKAYNRKLITEGTYESLVKLIDFECAILNNYIKTVGTKSK